MLEVGAAMSEREEDAKAILSHVPYITLATVGPDGLPWNTPVYAAFDKAYCFSQGKRLGDTPVRA